MNLRTKNTLNSIAGSFIGLLSIGILTGIAGFLYYLNWSFSPIIDKKDFLLIYAFVIISTALIWLAWVLMKRRRRYFALGFLVSLVIPVYVALSNIDSILRFRNPDPFSEAIWKSQPDKPIDMVHSLIRNDSLIYGKSRTEALQILGADTISEHTDEHLLTYRIDIARYTYFCVSFDEDEKAIELYYTYLD